MEAASQNKTPGKALQDILAITNRLAYDPTSAHWGWAACRRDLGDLEGLKEDLAMLGRDVFLDRTQEFAQLFALIKEVLGQVILLDKLTKSSESLWFGKRWRVPKILEKRSSLYADLFPELEQIHRLTSKLGEEYPRTAGAMRIRLSSEYPYLALDTIADYTALQRLHSSGKLQSSLFLRMHRDVLPLYKEESIHVSRLARLLDELEQGEHDLYFRNAAAYQRIVKPPSSRELSDERVFLDEPLFTLAPLVASVYAEDSGSKGSRLPYGMFDSVAAFTKSEPADRVQLAVQTFERLAKMRLRFEYVAKSDSIYYLLLHGTPGIADILHLFGVRKIRHEYDLDSLESLKKIFVKNDDFPSQKRKLAAIWKRLVVAQARHMYYIIIFFDLVDAVGIGTLEETANAGVQLDAANLQDLEANLKELREGSVRIQDIVSSSGGSRTSVLVVGPEDDYNTTLKYLMRDVRELPPSFAVHYAIASSAEHLAATIRETARKKKIDVLILGGHGTPGAITLSRGKFLDADSLRFFSGISACFSAGAYAYLISCSTGAISGGGIAQKIADVFRIKVIAPTDTSFKDITPGRRLFARGPHSIDVDFGPGVERETFTPQ